MWNHVDDLNARAKYEDLLREAEEHRRFTLYASRQPGVFERALAALKGAFAAKQPQPAQKPAAGATKRLAAE